MNISSLISDNYKTIPKEFSIQQAKEKIISENLVALLIVDDHKNLIGLLPESIIHCAGSDDSVVKIMSRPLFLKEKSSIEETMEFFEKQSPAIVAVKNSTGNICGILQSKNLLEYHSQVNQYFQDICSIAAKDWHNAHNSLKEILKMLMKYLKVDLAFVCQRQEKGCTIRAVEGRQGLELKERLVQKSQLCQRVLENKTTMTIQGDVDCHLFLEYFGNAARYSSFLGTPLIGRGDSQLGIIGACTIEQKKFDYRQKYLMSILAPVASERLERENQMVQMLQTDRLANMGTLSMAIVHNFNNILQEIISTMDILKEENHLDQQAEKLLNTARNDAEKLGYFSKEILSSLRNSATSSHRVDVDALFATINTLIHNIFPDNIRVIVDVPEKLPEILGHSGLLYQALLNLCINARDAMGDDVGTLRISTRVLQKKKEYLQIQVEDDGPGIPDHIKHHIFEPFFTTKQFHQGTGLGLFTVATIVDHHHGTLEFQSELEKGTIFTIHLPVVHDSPEKNSESIIRSQNKKVLIVDDNEAILKLMNRLLQRKGYDVQSYDSGEQVMEFLHQKQNIDLLVLDMNLPGFSGEHILHLFRKKRPEIKVLLISGMAHEDDLVNDLRPGKVEFLRKPYKNAAFVQKVADLLQ